MTNGEYIRRELINLINNAEYEQKLMEIYRGRLYNKYTYISY